MAYGESPEKADTPILPLDLDLPLQRLALAWGVHLDLLRVAAEIIESKTYFSARGWLRLLRESQEAPLTNLIAWRIHQQKTLLLSLAHLPTLRETETQLLLTLLQQMEVSPHVSAA